MDLYKYLPINNIIDWDLIEKEILHPFVDKLRNTEQEYIQQNHTNSKLTIVHGPAGRMISNYANDHKVDLVVIGCRGLNPMQEMVFGSVSTYVTKNANCSTLLVK